MTAPMCAEHKMPVIECESVEPIQPWLIRPRRWRLRLPQIDPGIQFGILSTFGCLAWVAFLAWLFLGHVRP